MQPCLAIREIELLRIVQRLVSSIRGDWPLQRLVSFEPLIAHACKHWSEGSNFTINLRRVLIIPLCTEPVCNVSDDLPIRPAFSQWLEHLIEPLNSSLSVRKRTFFFQTGAARQDYIGKTASDAEKDVLHDEEVELGERIADIVRIRIHNAHFFADHVQCL